MSSYYPAVERLADTIQHGRLPILGYLGDEKLIFNIHVMPCASDCIYISCMDAFFKSIGI